MIILPLLSIASWSAGFTPSRSSCRTIPSNVTGPRSYEYHVRKGTTALKDGVIFPVPDNFFTTAGFALGLALTVSRSINRVVLENRAWESRLEEARLSKLQDDDENMAGLGRPAYTELDLRRMDAANSRSAYGPEAMEERNGRRRGVRTMTRSKGDTAQEVVEEERMGNRKTQTQGMSDDEISRFEREFGISYDPYYDEPYTMDELPENLNYVEDKVYGDRRYENGEVFYRDEENSGLYWRQGGKPRLKRFWKF